MGRGSIQKMLGTNGTVSWRVRIEQPRSLDGTRRWASATFPTRREAEAYRAEMVSRAHRGIIDTAPRLCLGDYLVDRWLPFYQTQHRPSSFRQREMNCRVHIIPALGHYPLGQLTPSVVQTFYTELGRTIHASTVRVIAATLSAAMNSAVQWELIYRNPCVGAVKPKPTRRKPTIWTPKQTQDFIASDPDPDWRCFWSMLAVTGMRLGELLVLRWADIDFDRGLIHVLRTLSRAQRGYVVSEPKTFSATRTIVVPDALLTLLRATQERQEQRKRVLGEKRIVKGRGHYDRAPIVLHNANAHRYETIFDRGDGTPLSPSTVQHRWDATLTASGLPRIRKHDLRHGVATILLESGLDLKVVSEQLGHSSISITGDVYAHVTHELARRAAQVMAEKILGERDA